MRSPDKALRVSGPVYGDELIRPSLHAGGRCYYLPPHVYACRTPSGIVFLDAKRDRYFGLGGAHVAQLADQVIGLSGKRTVGDDAPSPAVSVAVVERVAKKLIGAGLLCLESGQTAQTAPRQPQTEAIQSIPPPDMKPVGTVSGGYPSVGAIDVVKFLWACVRASWWLRWLSLGSIASRVRAARREGLGYDVEQVLELVQRFQMLRSWSFSGKDRCLFCALSLIFFLQRYGCFPYLVIGVKTAPFAAHSWVQKDGLVLDGNPASVGHFVPILVA